MEGTSSDPGIVPRLCAGKHTKCSSLRAVSDFCSVAVQHKRHFLLLHQLTRCCRCFLVSIAACRCAELFQKAAEKAAQGISVKVSAAVFLLKRVACITELVRYAHFPV
jgi:hypothetical protein